MRRPIKTKLTTVANKRTLCPLESVEQQRVIAWAQWQTYGGGKVGDFLFAIPNGGSRAKTAGRFSQEALRMKKEGVRAGVPDLCLAIPTDEAHGLFIEMKRRLRNVSTVSKAQREWQARLRQAGYRSEICYGADAAIELIKEYLQIQ